MSDFESNLDYAKTKVLRAPLPPNLYRQAEQRAFALDVFGTALVGVLLILLSTFPFQSNLKAEPRPIAEIEHRQLVAMRGDQ